MCRKATAGNIYTLPSWCISDAKCISHRSGTYTFALKSTKQLETKITVVIVYYAKLLLTCEGTITLRELSCRKSDAAWAAVVKCCANVQVSADSTVTDKKLIRDGHRQEEAMYCLLLFCPNNRKIIGQMVLIWSQTIKSRLWNRGNNCFTTTSYTNSVK